ncbi:uncharacterized protein LOC115883747 [Sitophilus oryzae]|uniref:Uncharacterized protein LOC115883747 n=1 Tax=Sitophilus oryzae TaxID=7048 RepID=A0A6J2Y403_SITOR|nr:uncharacterized protein LOC115883747 [Sitophilus oryzae]
MPRQPKKKVGIGKTEGETMRAALNDIKNNGLSVKAAALRYKIPRTTLRRYVNKFENVEPENIQAGLTPNYTVNRIFTLEEEFQLCKYLQVCAKLHHGLTPRNVKKLAFELATANRKRVPRSWTENKMAGKHWLTQFLRRNPLSIRSAEATSLGRAMGFNKAVVQKFFNNLKEVLEKFKFRSDKIYNVDETALTTVQETGKVIATKEQKQVGQITSAERGTLITMCGAINANGNNIPPLLIFPRKYLKDHMLKGAPNGTIGAATPSGWMTTEIFVQWLKHFILYSHPTQEFPVLLLMDNHISHISIEAIKLARENNVCLLTLPPHTSHKLQPLDRTVYGPLKSYYNSACQSWLTNNPGKRITIYDISEILGQVYNLAFSTSNCVSGFKATGIFPFNENIFIDDDFLASTVTDMPPPVPVRTETIDDAIAGTSNESATDVEIAHTFCSEDRTPPNTIISPEMLRPLPKSQITEKKHIRKKKTTQILTSTPVYNELEATSKNKSRKKSLKKAPQAKRKVNLADTESSICDNIKIKDSIDISSDSTTDDQNLDLTDSDEIDWIDEAQPSTTEDLGNIDVGSFIVVKFATKKQVKFCVGRVTAIDIKYGEYCVSFLRKRKAYTFYYPDVPDQTNIPHEDVVMHLPPPC